MLYKYENTPIQLENQNYIEYMSDNINLVTITNKQDILGISGWTN